MLIRMSMMFRNLKGHNKKRTDTRMFKKRIGERTE